MSDEKMTLEIRHQIGVREDGSFFVRERIGDLPINEWGVPDRETATRLMAERVDMSVKMIAAISPETAKAVDEAIYIDNLKAGHA